MTLIGATTENPAFEVNGALLSRVRVYALEQLSAADVEAVLRRAVATGEPGAIAIDDEALALLASRVEGDARMALNALELAAETASGLDEQSVSAERAADALQRRAVLYDRAGDRHYDYISAWIKATRGSDPDASLYYLAVMLEGGEDPRFIVRRMVILASEDIGNADPAALEVAVAAANAVEHVGHAGGTLRARAGRDLPRARAEVERRGQSAGRGAGARARARRAAGPAVARERPAAGAQTLARRSRRGGLRQPARAPGARQRPAAPARGAGGRALLRPRRGRGAAAPRLQEIRRARGR